MPDGVESERQQCGQQTRRVGPSGRFPDGPFRGAAREPFATQRRANLIAGQSSLAFLTHLISLRKPAVLSVRPKVAELAFHVFSRSLHPELYAIHKSRDVVRQQYSARIDITNCGHVVTWKAANMTVCEVATSAHQPLPKKRCLLSKALKGSRTERANLRGGLNYRTHFQLEPVEPDLFWMVQQQLGNGPTEGLLHNFDASGRMALGALSYVSVETRQRSMLVQAIHTFPDDFAIVKVESLFSLPSDVDQD